MKQATTLSEVKFSCDPRPLGPEDLDAFFVETAEARDPVSNRRFEISEGLGKRYENAKIVLAGHGGTGKSTELTKFCEEQRKRYHPAVISIRREAVLSNVTIEQLLVLVVEKVLSSASDFEHDLSTKTIDSVYAWFSETFEKSESSRASGIEVGGEVKAETPSLIKLLHLAGWLKADMRIGAQIIHSSITKENRRVVELADRCGEVLKEVSLALAKVDRELLVVIEDLDKASIPDAQRLFFDEPGPLADLPCKAIYTFPIFLMCSPRMAGLDPRFKRTTLPMIKVRDHDLQRDGTGFGVMQEMLGRRMRLELIEDSALELAIDKTGGVPRDLFEVMITAASVARQARQAGKRAEEKILWSDVRYGLNRRKSQLLSSISVQGLPDNFQTITVEDLYRRLKEYGEKAIDNAPSDPTNQALIQAHALIEYNGERWFRVHPLVSEHVTAIAI